MTFNLTDAESYKAYFLLVATKNKLLGADNYLYGELEVGQSEAGEWKYKKLWTFPSTRATGSRTHDNYFLKRQNSVWIGGPSPGEKFAIEDSFFFDCEVIMKQVISKLILDESNCEISFDPGSIVWERTTFILSGTKFIGVELQFNHDDPDDLQYDENDWNP